jgi:hypothetical protein
MASNDSTYDIDHKRSNEPTPLFPVMGKSSSLFPVLGNSTTGSEGQTTGTMIFKQDMDDGQ